MEPYLIISNLNDFVFCPRSIYFHNLYGGYTSKNYHRTAQTKGKHAHQTIDQNKYSTQKKFIAGIEIYSQKYNLSGKIDVYDSQSKTLIERKRKITTIYDGYRYQLYAQYYCMTEMGYPVEHLFFHSLADNKRYSVAIPEDEEKQEFENLINNMKNFQLCDSFQVNEKKCKQCIYVELCDYGGDYAES